MIVKNEKMAGGMMNSQEMRDLLNAFDFDRLFVEHLGWDRHGGELSVDVGGETYLLSGLAQKRGVQILECRASDGETIPDYNTRKKIEKQVTKATFSRVRSHRHSGGKLRTSYRMETETPMGIRSMKTFKRMRTRGGQGGSTPRTDTLSLAGKRHLQAPR